MMNNNSKQCLLDGIPLISLIENIQIPVRDRRPDTALTLDSKCCAHITKEVIKHILFMRQQIPCLFSELESEAQDLLMAELHAEASDNPLQHRKKRRRLNLKEKKRLKTYHSALALFQACDQMFHSFEAHARKKQESQDQSVQSVHLAIAIGSSVYNISEVFILKFMLDVDASCIQENSTFKLQSLSQQVIRALVTSGPLIFNSNCMLNKVHLLAMMDKSLSSDGSSALLEFVVPKQQLALKLKIPRPKQKYIAQNETSIPNILVVEVGSNQWFPFDTEESLNFVQQNVVRISGLSLGTNGYAPSDLIWFLSKSTVKGYLSDASKSNDNDLFM